MFDILPNLLSSVASFLFPVYASYKALRSSDPAQLTPWLMYWVVISFVVLVESWVGWFLVWVPFYAFMRFVFLLYLVLPQTQGARVIYQTHIEPWLEANEGQIEDFIASAHERLKAAGLAYLKQAIEYVKTQVLGMPPTPPEPASASYGGGAGASQTAQSYTQSLLARFNVPSARPGGANNASGGALGTDFYSFLSSAVTAASNAYSNKGSGTQFDRDVTPTPGTGGGASSLVPESIRGVDARISFIEAQRERLNTVLNALDREASQLQNNPQQSGVPGFSFDGADIGLTSSAGNPWQGSNSRSGKNSRSMSEHSSVSGGGLSRNRSEADFEKLEAESGEEEIMDDNGRRVRHRPAPNAQGSSGWFGWGAGGADDAAAAKSTGVDK
ncbi:TB2/DP1, HVA22 family-domain-containing protein [Neurospora crassa]|nr:TB2/DP1, HVA22 family-domain-containing protein [Neurospora crassa]